MMPRRILRVLLSISLACAGLTLYSGSAAAVQDEVAPTILIISPSDQGGYSQNAVILAEYVCIDEEGGSGLAGCIGTAQNGDAIDTSTVGIHYFSVTATDLAGNAASQIISYSVQSDDGVLSGIVTDSTGRRVTASITAVDAVSGVTEGTTTANSSGVFSLGLPTGTYDVTASWGDLRTTQSNVVIRPGPNSLDLQFPGPAETFSVRGRLLAGNEPMSASSIFCGAAVGATDQQGVFALQLPSGSCVLTVRATGGSGFEGPGSSDNRVSIGFSKGLTVDHDMDLGEIVIPARPVTIHVTDGVGVPIGNASVYGYSSGSVLSVPSLLGDIDVLVDSRFFAATDSSGTVTPIVYEAQLAFQVSVSGTLLTLDVPQQPVGSEMTFALTNTVVVHGRIGSSISRPQAIVEINSDVLQVPVQPDGEFSFEAPRGPISLRVDGGVTLNGEVASFSATRQLVVDQAQDLGTLEAPLGQATISVTRPDGSPAPGVALRLLPQDTSFVATMGGADYHVSVHRTAGAVTGADGNVTLDLLGSASEVSIDNGDGGTLRIPVEVRDAAAVSVSQAPTVPVTGRLLWRDLAWPGQALKASCQSVSEVGWRVGAVYEPPQLLPTADGLLSTRAVPGSLCHADFEPLDDRLTPTTVFAGTENRLSVTLPIERIGSDVHLGDLSLPVHRLTAYVARPNGAPISGAHLVGGRQGCSTATSLSDGRQVSVCGLVEAYATSGGDGLAVLHLPVSGVATVSAADCSTTGVGESITTDVEATIVCSSTAAVVYVDTSPFTDNDNINPAVEAGVPNLMGDGSGDGNGDGIADAVQVNVASVPTFGGSSTSNAFVTVAVPPGTSLTNVYTLDQGNGSQVVAPPPGLVLPEGLTKFLVRGITPGSDVVVQVYTASTAGITGYAKYDELRRTWSVLPADRVNVIDAHRVDIRLTDGGIGDADGVANGVVDDPGGLAEVTDVVAPVVTGQSITAPNADGWYSSDVTIRWTATDPVPGDASVNGPPDTVLSTEGAGQQATSGIVCDSAGNCSTGQVGGISIDKTPPTVRVVGPADGAVYTLGGVPTVSCTAVDDLSGIANPCAVSSTGGLANGVGSFVVRATASDHAGNARSVQAAYRVVYRFDGFVQPINDPSIDPVQPLSVFKAGGVVPVSFALRDATGAVVAPNSAPLWVQPVRNGVTTARVNETSPKLRASTGATYSLVNGSWEYNWATKKSSDSGLTYQITVNLDDGTTHTVTVGVR